MDKHRITCAKLLKLFEITNKIQPNELNNFQTSSSQLYAQGPVYSFNFKDKKYYVVDDYSLDDDPKLVKNILLDINHTLTGGTVHNPITQADGAEYAAGLDGVEYYLWEES